MLILFIRDLQIRGVLIKQGASFQHPEVITQLSKKNKTLDWSFGMINSLLSTTFEIYVYKQSTKFSLFSLTLQHKPSLHYPLRKKINSLNHY